MHLKKYVISDNSTIYVEIVNLGARLHHLGQNADHNVLVSPTDVNDYRNDVNWMGATIGPRAHLLRDGVFTKKNGNLYYEKNYQGHHLHGGEQGFHRQIWNVEKHTNNMLFLGLNSRCGGRFTVQYKILRHSLSISYTAKVRVPTVVNMTNHAYFNLSAEDKIYNHHIKINADAVVDTDDSNLPLPQDRTVANSILDLREFRQLSVIKAIKTESILKKTNGYNHCYLFDRGVNKYAEIDHPAQQCTLRVTTTKPAIQFFTANNIHALTKGKLWRHAALCLEPVYPISDYLQGDDALSLLHSGQEYCETDTYQFINRLAR